MTRNTHSNLLQPEVLWHYLKSHRIRDWIKRGMGYWEMRRKWLDGPQSEKS
jgi:hypothetical protein